MGPLGALLLYTQVPICVIKTAVAELRQILLARDLAANSQPVVMMMMMMMISGMMMAVLGHDIQ